MEPKKKTNEAVFVIFMSKLYILMSFPLVSFKVNSILMENGRKTQQNRTTMALPVNATRRDRDWGGGGSRQPQCFINLEPAHRLYMQSK